MNNLKTKTKVLLTLVLLSLSLRDYQTAALLASSSPGMVNTIETMKAEENNLPPITPSSPTNLVAEPGVNAVKLTFTEPANDSISIVNYEYSLDDGTTWTPFQPAVTTSPVTIRGLTPCTAYNIRLRAVNENGAGLPSASVTAIPRSGEELGRDWRMQTLPTWSTWTDVTYGNGLYVAVANSGAYRVMISSDAVNWTVVSNVPQSAWTAIAFGDGIFVAVASDESNNVMISNDASTGVSVLLHHPNMAYIQLSGVMVSLLLFRIPR
jgi:hypothetical protein